jgi:hypothetical protein
LRRASTFLLWLQALMATIAHAAPAANHSSDSIPRALSSRLRRKVDAGTEFIMDLLLLLAAGPLYVSSSQPTSIPGRVDLVLGNHNHSTTRVRV